MKVYGGDIHYVEVPSPMFSNSALGEDDEDRNEITRCILFNDH